VNNAKKNVKSAQTAVFAKIAESAMIASAAMETSARTVISANSASIRFASNAVKAVRNAP